MLLEKLMNISEKNGVVKKLKILKIVLSKLSLKYTLGNIIKTEKKKGYRRRIVKKHCKCFLWSDT